MGTNVVRLWVYGASFLIAMAMVGCSDDSGDGDAPGAEDNGASNVADTMPADSASAGNGASDTAAADPMMPADGMQAAAMDLAAALPTCDATVPTTATCGGTACPAPGAIAAVTCSVPCCVNDACGTMTAVEGNVGSCAAGATEDPSCPGYSGDAMGMAVELPGCCTEDGVCGAISSLSMQCITTSMFLADLAPGGPCGAGGGGEADAGMGMGGSDAGM